MYKCQKSTVYSLPPRKSRLTEIFFYGINFPTCFQLSYFSEHEEKEVFKELAVIFLLLIVVVEIMRVSQSKIVFFFLHLPTLIIVFFFYRVLHDYLIFISYSRSIIVFFNIQQYLNSWSDCASAGTQILYETRTYQKSKPQSLGLHLLHLIMKVNNKK